ncbi:hypothetical protein [Stigmatella aurantiaca]|uniref:Uncharacterized protein n=1 Tax=Stigmatella aurantiaca (strain DW4/3-1) TaxID=378806 RepID=Q09E78_STIAD|nr:hypothetical protein [Stigmatella aurantiaca]ADO74710.1 uncharacterized protein STAUR_6954 [Stigmatella aurantiaca DW4/3-1]EAU70072.1 hypothetical protein STIAU_8364 [Stigmatella aurantiaca DW4/3-1]
MPDKIQIDPGPLSEEEVHKLTPLVGDLARRHPGLLGLRLIGSAIDPEEALPCGDLDVSWYGHIDATSGDERVIHGAALFEYDGLLIDLARYQWSDFNKIESTCLPAAVATRWAHPIWEREPVFSRARQNLRPLLLDRDWLKRGVDLELRGIRGHLDRWRNPAARPAIGGNFDLMRAWGGWLFLPFLAAVNFCLPSGSRRGLGELRRVSERLGLPWIWRELYSIMGADRPDRTQLLDWSQRVSRLFSRAQAQEMNEHLPRTKLLLRRRYYVEGIQALLARGQEAEATRPLWLAAHGLHELFGATPDAAEAEALVLEVRGTLGITSHGDDVVLPRLERLSGIVSHLERHREHLIESMHREALKHCT